MTRFITSSFSHLILLIGILIMVVPVWMIFASSTHTSSMINMNGLQMFLGDSFYENYLRVLLYQGGFFKEITALKMFFNSFIMATGVAILSVTVDPSVISVGLDAIDPYASAIGAPYFLLLLLF